MVECLKISKMSLTGWVVVSGFVNDYYTECKFDYTPTKGEAQLALVEYSKYKNK